jgi:hypothetical protein
MNQAFMEIFFRKEIKNMNKIGCVTAIALMICGTFQVSNVESVQRFASGNSARYGSVSTKSAYSNNGSVARTGTALGTSLRNTGNVLQTSLQSTGTQLHNTGTQALQNTGTQMRTSLQSTGTQLHNTGTQLHNTGTRVLQNTGTQMQTSLQNAKTQTLNQAQYARNTLQQNAAQTRAAAVTTGNRLVHTTSGVLANTANSTSEGINAGTAAASGIIDNVGSKASEAIQHIGNKASEFLGNFLNK